MPRGFYKRTEYHRKQMSKGATNRKITPLFRQARSDNAKINPNYGMKGKHHSEETKKKLSMANKGKTTWMKGKHHSDEAKRKLSEYRGPKASNWRGGISFEPYSINWTDTLKKSIRERDHYICQLCLKDGYPVHHVDYDKKNCCPGNLITLCNRCNARVNFNRDYWKTKFTTN